MSAARLIGRVILSVAITQLVITVPWTMAQLGGAPTPAPAGVVAGAGDESGSKSNAGAIVGGVIGGVLATILVIVAVLLYRLQKLAALVTSDKTTLPTSQVKPPTNSPPYVPPQPTPQPRPDVKGLNAQVPVPQQDVAYNLDVRRYSYEEVTAISSNWMYKLGEGGFGAVYYGEIFRDAAPNTDPQKVALKRMSPTSQQGKNEFLNEVRLLSRIHFRYLVPLVGFCDDINNQVLIYEYVQEGSLADWLHGAQQGRSDFTWYYRLLIALHAALGLEYLHVGARPNIIHRDVKSSNILITREWEGRVADFGLSKTGIIDQDQQRTHMTTLVKGTPGYLDPEYFRTAKLTTKSDVYSFGIVLLELITGRLPIDYSQQDPQLRCIESYVQTHYPHNLASIADPSLQGNYNMRSLQKIAQVALQSVALQGINRPTMSDVVGEIRNAIKLVEGGESPAAATNTPEFLTEFVDGISETPATKTTTTTAPPIAADPARPRSGPRNTFRHPRGSASTEGPASSSSTSHSASSSATSVPSSVAFPR